MSIQSEITRLQNAKTSISQAIAGKGVNVGDADTIDAYATAREEIQVADATIYTGSAAPDNSMGKDGDLYIMV